MGKIEVNNEVVLLRHLVRQARVRIVHNLTREIKILRVKRGDEKKLIKFKRRAARFLDEVNAAKKIEDDEVTKFGILNTKSLFSILDDPASDAKLRFTAKCADYPELKEGITKLKAKFPDYEQFLGPGRKKLARLQMKAAKKEIKNKEKEKDNEEEAGEDNVKNSKKKKKGKIENENSDDEDKDSDDEMDIEENEEDEEEVDEDEEDEINESEEVTQDEEEDEMNENDEVIQEEKEVDQDEEMYRKEDEDENSDNTEKIEKNKTSKTKLKHKNTQKLKPAIEDSSNLEIEVKNVKKANKKVLNYSQKENSEDVGKAEKSKTSKTELKHKTTQKLKPASEDSPNSETEVKKVKKANKKDLKHSLKEKHKQTENKLPKDIKQKEIQPVSKEATVKRFSELIKEEETKKASKKIKLETKFEKVGLKKEVDSFFMTADGSENYMSVVIPKKQIENPNDDFEHENSHREKNLSRNKNDRFFTNINTFEGRSDKFRKNKMDRKHSEDKFEPKFEKRGRNESKNAGKFGKKNETSEEHLHPSWAAKKKEQDALKLGFQGKKIVFGDD